MQKVRCGECGKIYDFDQDDFCPRCGAFTLPPREGRGGAVIRREGINESNHQGSFVHAELHQENRRRQGTPLVRQTGKKEKNVSSGQLLWWILLGIIAVNFLLSLSA